MRRSLPKEQDKLLKELKDLETRVNSGTKPERNYVLFGLGVVATISFLLISISDYYSNSGANILAILGIWIILIISIIACYKGNKIGALVATFISLSLNIALSYTFSMAQDTYQSLSLIADIFVLLLVTSLFVNKGYLASTVLLILKNFYFQFVLGVNINYVTVLVDTIIILVTGTFLLMIMYLFRLAENARMQMLRAEILALQNQELVGSWENFFKK